MSITVKDCFALPSLSGGTLIAGHHGLDEIVTRISVLEYDAGVEQESSKLFTYNELLISSFYSLKDDVTAQCKSLRYFKETGNVGLVLLYVGDILTAIDPLLIETANQIDLPLFLVKGPMTTIRYSDIITDVMEAIFMDNRRENNFVQATMKILSRLPAHQRSIDSLLRIMSDQSKVSLFLCDPNEILIAHALWPLHSELDYEYFVRMEAESQDTQTANDRYFVEVTEDCLETYYHTIQIRCNQELLYLKLIDQGENFSPALLTEIEECLSIFSSVYHYNLNTITTKALVDSLLKGNDYLAQEIAQELQIDLSKLQYFHMICRKSPDKSVSTSTSQFTSQSTSQQYATFLQRLKVEQGERGTAYIGETFEDYCVILSFTDISHSLEVLLQDSSTLQCMTYGVQSYQELPAHYKELVTHLPILQCVFSCKTQWNVSHMYFARQLKHLQADEQECKRILGIIEPLTKDKKHDLMETLFTYYFLAERESKTTAELLYVHRNTIQYRLQKIKELVSHDLNQLPDSIELYTACALHALNGTYSTS